MKKTIDCTPTDGGFAICTDRMLDSIQEMVRPEDVERLHSLMAGVLDCYKYLYFRGYRYSKNRNRLVLAEKPVTIYTKDDEEEKA